MLYNWQQKDWIKVTHDASKFEAAALEFREFAGQKAAGAAPIIKLYCINIVGPALIQTHILKQGRLKD